MGTLKRGMNRKLVKEGFVWLKTSKMVMTNVLMQVPHIWRSTKIETSYFKNTRIDVYFKQNGYDQCLYENVIYNKMNKNRDILLIFLYIDDFIFIRSNSLIFKKFKQTII